MFGKCGFSKTLLVFWALSFGVPAIAAQQAVVNTDSAMVYKQPNFDARVLGYLKAGRRITVSSKKFGGAFHRLRLKQGVFGYISDVDIQVTGGSKPKGAFANEGGESEEAKEKRSAPKRNLPPVGRTYLGLAGGTTKYSEIINKTEYSDQVVTFGLKLTTPFSIIDGPFLFDLQIHGNSKAPGYYDTLSDSGAKGLFFMTNIQMLYPLMEFAGRRGVMYFGGGPMIAYSSFQIEKNNSKLNLDELRAGALFSAGLGFDMGGSLIFKIEPKYYIERASYNAFDLSIQFGF